MARLSVEHYRASANMTPEHVRKSSRLRDMFRSRPSSSNSLIDPSTRSPPAKSPLSPPVSPTSPTVKPGFEQVGLLPSERGSMVDVKGALEANGGSRVAEVLEKQMGELKSTSAPHGLDTGLDVANVGQVDDVSKQVQETEYAKERNEIAEASKEAMSTAAVTSESSALPTDAAEAPISSLRHSTNREELKAYDPDMPSTAANACNGGSTDSEKNTKSHDHTSRPLVAADSLRAHGQIAIAPECYYNNTPSKGKKMEDAAVKSPAPEFMIILERSPKPSRLEEHVAYDASKLGTFHHYSKVIDNADENNENALDHLDDDGWSSTNSAEDLPIQFAEEHLERNRGSAGKNNDDGTEVMTITLQIKLAKNQNQPESAIASVSACHSELFGAPKSLGNITITDPILAIVLQSLVTAFYIWIALSVLVYGPVQMFSMIFVVSIGLAAYFGAMGQVAAKPDAQDLLLTPLTCVSSIFATMLSKMADKAAQSVARILVEALRDSANIKTEVQE